MAISKCNAEGYYDPTAYEGIRRAEADNGKLKIVYPTGYMELNLEGFFPCPLDKARKVFSLIHRYSPEPDKDRLLSFLRRLEKRYFAQMQEYANEAVPIRQTQKSGASIPQSLRKLCGSGKEPQKI